MTTTMMSETASDGVDKVARYKWQIRNRPGEMQWVPKGRLQIDVRYQRPVNDRKRLRIAQRFNWVAFGVLIAARRSAKTLWLIDGQHRWMAAMSRSDIPEVPVMIFDLDDDIAEEAKDFLIANKDRKPLAGSDTFKAQVAAGDTAAQIVELLVTQSGRKVASNSSAQTIACVRSLCKCCETDANALQRIWPIVVQLCRGRIFDQRLVLGLFLLERRLLDHNGNRVSVSERRMSERLYTIGVDELLRSIGDASAYFAKGGELVCAKGLVKALNYKRVHRLQIAGVQSEIEPE